MVEAARQVQRAEGGGAVGADFAEAVFHRPDAVVGGQRRLVDGAIVEAQAESSVFFSYTENGRVIRGVRRLDDAAAQPVVDVLADDGHVGGRDRELLLEDRVVLRQHDPVSEQIACPQVEFIPGDDVVEFQEKLAQLVRPERREVGHRRLDGVPDGLCERPRRRARPRRAEPLPLEARRDGQDGAARHLDRLVRGVDEVDLGSSVLAPGDNWAVLDRGDEVHIRGRGRLLRR
jgi:hypothetical protein